MPKLKRIHISLDFKEARTAFRRSRGIEHKIIYPILPYKDEIGKMACRDFFPIYILSEFAICINTCIDD